jgi:uncharacterized membrane protein YfcA
LVGCALARRVPAQRLKAAVAVVAMFAGLQLVWSGAHSLAARHPTSSRMSAAGAVPMKGFGSALRRSRQR